MKTSKLIGLILSLFTAFVSNAFAQAVAPAQFINLSTRAKIGSGLDVLTLGFVVVGIGDGNLSTRVLIRGVGPKLSAFRVVNPASDPRITVFNKAGVVIAQNDDWSSNTALSTVLMQTANQVGAFPLDVGSKDAAVIVNLPPGDYTAQITDPTSLGREALIEVYTVTRDTGVLRLGNMSVLSSDSPLIVGFVADGRSSKRVLVRAIGPGLSQFGVQNVMADPRLTVFDAQGRVVIQNDNWDNSAGQFFAPAGAFPLVAGSRDAAVSWVMNVSGPMSVSAAGQDATTNNAVSGRRMLVELFEVN